MTAIVDGQTDIEDFIRAYNARVAQIAKDGPAAPKRDVRLVGLWSPAPQSGKTTAARALLDATGRRFDWLDPVVSFAAPMRELIGLLLRQQGVPGSVVQAHMTDGALKEVPIPGVGKSFVEIAIKIGTELGRGWLGEDTWIKPWERHVTAALEDRNVPIVLTDDARFPNEAAAIRRLGGVLIGIHRPGTTVSAARAAAEGKLTLDDMDVVVENDTGKAIFEARVVAAARKLGVDV